MRGFLTDCTVFVSGGLIFGALPWVLSTAYGDSCLAFGALHFAWIFTACAVSCFWRAALYSTGDVFSRSVGLFGGTPGRGFRRSVLLGGHVNMMHADGFGAMC